MTNRFKECIKSFKEKSNIYLVLLDLDKLNDSNRIISFIGFVFIFMAALNFSGQLILNNLILISISLSGISFVGAEFCDYFIKKIDMKKATPFNIRARKKKKYNLLKIIFHFLAVSTLIIGPYLNINLNYNFLEQLSNSLPLIAIGLTVLKIGLDNSLKKQSNELKMMTEIGEVFKELESKEKEKNNNNLNNS